MNKRINDIEFRWGNGGNPEIVQWDTDRNGKDYCFTLLCFSKDKEGYYVKFVGDRTLNYHDTEILWKLMRYGNSVYNATLELEEE